MTHAPEVHIKTITFRVTYNGVTKTLTEPITATVKSALEKAIHEFHVSSQPHVLAFYREDGSEVMPETMPLGEARISESSLLVLRPSAVKGG